MINYTKEVIDNFMHPKNMGEIKNPDGIGKVGSIICGDITYVYLLVEQRGGNDIIKDIKFKTFGCAAAISSASMITQLAKSKTIKQAKKICLDDIIESLKGMPPLKLHCSQMAVDALMKSIKNFEENLK